MGVARVLGELAVSIVDRPRAGEPWMPTAWSLGDEGRGRKEVIEMANQSGGRRTLSLEEISDRMFIQDLVIEEAAAIDERDWDGWEAAYVADAKIDWSGNGGAKGDPKTVRAWAASVLSEENFPYPQYQHYCTNFRIRVNGDEATCRHLQIIPISVVSPGGGRQIAFSGIWFDDDVVRTADGWKIAARKESRAWQHNFPETFEIPKA